LSRKEKYGLITQMDIKYLGHASFRLRGKTTAVVTDPFDPKLVGYAFPKITSDIVTISHMHPDHNMSSLVKPRVEGKMPIVINGPGEYEIKGFETSDSGYDEIEYYSRPQSRQCDMHEPLHIRSAVDFCRFMVFLGYVHQSRQEHDHDVSTPLPEWHEHY